MQAPVGQHPLPRGLDPSRQGSLPQASRFCPHPLTFVSTTLGTVAASQSYCLSGAPASPLYLFGSPILRFEFPLLNYFLLKRLVCFLTNTHRSSKIQTQVYLTPSPVPWFLLCALPSPHLQPADKDSLLDQTWLKLANLLLGPSVHCPIKSSLSKNPAKSV